MNGQPMAVPGIGKLKACVLSLYSYPLFNPACMSPFGGSEVRISLIAKELAKYADLDMSVIVFDHGQQRRETLHGVTLIPWTGRYCPLQTGNPWAGACVQRKAAGNRMDAAAGIQPLERAVFQNPTSLKWSRHARLYIKAHSPKSLFQVVRRMRYPFAAIKSNANRVAAFVRGEELFGSIQSHAIRYGHVKIYDEIGADLYMAHGNHNLTAQLAFYCRRRGKKYVMISGSDQDFIAAHKTQTDLYGELGFLMAYTIRNADLIIVQTRRQAELAKTCFGRDAVVIPNPVDTAPRFPRADKTESILWVGKSDDCVKQPEIFMELARRMPRYEFVMIMNLAIDHVHRHILKESHDIPNLRIVTYVPYDQVEKYFAGARLLVNTSKFEGFPDTFLQASKYGVPVVSLQVDPDGMLSKHGCGLESGGDFERLVGNVSLLMSDDDRRCRAARSCRTYLSSHHSKEVLIPKYREAMLSLLEEN